MNGSMAADAEARRRIREDIGTSFFVEAGAGSGKTTELVNRMAAMVESGIPVEKICAITFTVAASREFFNRFQKKLAERRTDSTVPKNVKALIRAAMRNIDLCFMGTIDAFCNQVLGEHPARAGVPSVLCLADDTDRAGLYRREYARLKRGEYGEELTRLFRDFCAVQEKPDRAFLGSIQTFMNAHAADWAVPVAPREDWRGLFSAELEELRSILEILSHCPENLSERNKDSRAARDSLQDAVRILGNYRDGASFPEILNILRILSVSDDEKKMNGLTLECEPAAAGIKAESLFTARGKKSGVYCLFLSQKGGLISRMTEYQYSVTVRFLSEAAAGIAKALKRNGELTYYDYLLYLRNMLREDAAAGGRLVRHIRSHYSYFLIDEFQDTDPLQAEVFFRLASEAPWRKCKPRPGSLFIVGDPKQSIYRFRGADVGSYLSVKRLFVPPVGETLSLQRNFRSSPALCRWFNAAFESMLPEDTPYQSRFKPIPDEREAEETGPLSGVWSYRTDKKDNSGKIADIVRRLTDNPAYLIHPRKERENGLPPRRIRYRDIMVITRTKAPLATCLSAMKEYGIPCSVDGRTAFGESPAFIAMADLMAALADPLSSAAAYRVLRGDLFRFSREDLSAWARKRGNRFYVFAHRSKKDAISAALTRLNEFRKQHTMLSPSALCRAMLEEFDLFGSCGTENMEYVWYAIEMLRYGADSRGSMSVTDASALLSSLAEGKRDPGKVLDLSGEPDRVYLANLHKVKGLEAPVVILAYSDLLKHEPGAHMEADGPDQKRWVFRLTGSEESYTSMTYAVTERYGEEAEKERASLDAAEIRLMYVAATRAGCALLIPSGENSLWNPLLAAGAEDLETIMPAETVEKGLPEKRGFEQDPEQRKKLVDEKLLSGTGEKTWKLITPSRLGSGKVRKEGPEEDLPRGEASSGELGELIHRAMEMLVSSRATLSDEEITETIREEYNPDGDPKKNADLELVRTMLDRARNGGWKQESGSPVPDDILSELLSADEIYCEVPFCTAGKKDGKQSVTHGIMDVVYRKGKAWFVVDYKTDSNPYGLDQVHKKQMNAYRRAVRKLLGAKKAEVHTYHIPLGK